MTRTWSTALVAAAVVAGGGGWWSAARLAAMERNSAAVTAAAAAAAAEIEVRTRDIAFYEARASEDPESAADLARLAALHLQRARETADFEDYLRAESAARASLALRTQRNGAAFVSLASSLLAQHRFAEARDAARRLVAGEPHVEGYRALLGETCLEIGDYACARAAFDSIRGRSSLAVAPPLARWAEIRGDTATARLLLRRAVALAAAEPGLPREQLAWMHLRAGDLELRQGRAWRAEREFQAGLAASPGDHRLLGAMARLAAARHEWRDAIEYGDRAIAVVLDPATLGVVSDAHAALGDTAMAAQYVRTMEVAAGQQPGAYHRAWSLFLLDHGRRAPDVLAAAEAEIRERPDVHGYDLLAWALYRGGRVEEARRAMARALASGTGDALLLYHAGMIERAAGSPVAATGYLRRALAVSRYFDHAAPAVAQAALDSLDRATVRAR
jgi:tetratricopeptide (TPR) repeat protein